MDARFVAWPEWVWVLAVFVGLLVGCDDKAVPSPDAGKPAGGLTPEQAGKVVAKVGNRTITLGEFAATLERMNPDRRLRYQTKERRRELLQEMIDTELLAQEALRRGLDKQEKVEDSVRQVLRNAMLNKARRGVPTAKEIHPNEVRKYYEKHREKFQEPELRRVSAIVMSDKVAAEKVLEQAREVRTGKQWGQLYYEHSITAPKRQPPHSATDLAGDLALVGPPGDAKGANKRVPAAVQKALFTLKKEGEVYDQLIAVAGKFYIIRMSGRTPGHVRSLAEAQSWIRNRLVHEKEKKRYDALQQELRRRFPVTINDEALKAVKLPAGVDKKGASSKPPPGRATTSKPERAGTDGGL